MSSSVYLLLAPLVKEADIVVDGGEQNLAEASFDGQTKGRARHRIDLELADELTFRREFHDFTVVTGVGGMITSTIHVLILVPVFFALMKERALRQGTLRPAHEVGPQQDAQG